MVYWGREPMVMLLGLRPELNDLNHSVTVALKMVDMSHGNLKFINTYIDPTDLIYYLHM